MTIFDMVYKYQFVVFFGTPTEEQKAKAAAAHLGLPKIFSRPTKNGLKKPVVKLSSSQAEQFIAVNQLNSDLSPITKISWGSPGNIWRLEWSTSRLDLYFDARAHADIKEDTEISITKIWNRISDNLIESIDALDLPVNRVAILLTGEASTSILPEPTKIVAKTFYNEKYKQLACENELLDIRARVNQKTNWNLSDDKDENAATLINRIQTVEAKWMIRTGQVERSLSWQLDANTTPFVKPLTKFSHSEITLFFKKGIDWIEENLDFIEKVGCDA